MRERKLAGRMGDLQHASPQMHSVKQHEFSCSVTVRKICFCSCKVFIFLVQLFTTLSKSRFLLTLKHAARLPVSFDKQYRSRDYCRVNPELPWPHPSWARFQNQENDPEIKTFMAIRTVHTQYWMGVTFPSNQVPRPPQQVACCIQNSPML